MKYVTDDDSLSIELEGFERFWALKTKLTILRENIIVAEYRELFDDWRKWEVRLPGTGMPGKLIAGSFWTERGWDFLYLINPHGWANPSVYNVLCIETNQPRYRRIIVSCSQLEAQKVAAWARAS